MRRRNALALIGTALTASVAGCGGLGTADETETPTDETPPTDTPTETPTTPQTVVNGSFEADWAGWTVGRDLPLDPNAETERAVASEAGVTTRTATDGVTACRLFIDGSQDDGTVWVQQPLDFSGADYLAIDYLVSDSFNEIRKAAVYAGPEPETPLTETDFDTSQSLEGHARPGWKTLTYDVTQDGPGLLAVGFSVVWETGSTTLLDNIRVSADPPVTVTPPTPTEQTDNGGLSE